MHVVVLQGLAVDVKKADAQILAAQTSGHMGWAKMLDGVWIVQSEGQVAAWRDYIHSRFPKLQVMVAQLNGSWASSGFAEIAAWLKETDDGFW